MVLDGLTPVDERREFCASYDFKSSPYLCFVDEEKDISLKDQFELAQVTIFSPTFVLTCEDLFALKIVIPIY